MTEHHESASDSIGNHVSRMRFEQHALAQEKLDDVVLTWHATDPKHPTNWSPARKWLVTGVALVGTLLLPMNGTSITVAVEQINNEFAISDAAFLHSYWPVTSWSIGGAVFIILFLPLMEDLGVKMGYILFYVLFYAMLVAQARAASFATLIVTRFFSGGCVALLANTISSIIPDLWSTDRQRSLPVSIYIVCYVVGSTLGPVVFAPVSQHLHDWRWIFYIQLIIYGVIAIPTFFTLKETRADVILRRYASTFRRSTGVRVRAEPDLQLASLQTRLRNAVSRPFFLLFTEPVLFASTLWSAFSFGTVFLFTQSSAQVFSGLYGWDEYSIGYVQGAVVIGEILGWTLSFYSTKLYLRSADNNAELPGQAVPEARLYVSIPASFLGVAGGMFVYAWTSYSWLPWILPAVGLAMVGFGIQVVVSSVADYVVDAYAASGVAGSAISAVASVENIVAGFLPLAAQSMYTNLGFQWASTLLGCIALLLSVAPVVFVWKGRTLRERSPFMQSNQQISKIGSHAMSH